MIDRDGELNQNTVSFEAPVSFLNIPARLSPDIKRQYLYVEISGRGAGQFGKP